MMDWLETFIRGHEHIMYLIVFIATLIEGDITLLLCGALAREGIFDVTKLFAVATSAGILHDTVFWYIGHKLTKWGKKKFFFFDVERMAGFIDRFKNSMGVFVFISKFAWNFNRIVLAASGYANMHFKKFIKYSFPAIVLWAATLLSIGYVFADRTKIFQQRIEIFGLLITGFVILLALFEMYLKKIMQKYFKLPDKNTHTESPSSSENK